METTFIVAVSFSKTRNHKGAHQTSQETEGPQHCFSGQKLLLFLLVSEQPRHKLLHLSHYPLEFTGILHIRGLTCWWLLKWEFVNLHWQFCELPSHFCLWNLWRDNLNDHNLSWSFHTFESRKPINSVLPITLSLKSILSISYVANVAFSSLKQQQYTILYMNVYKAAYCPEHAYK